MKVLVTGAGGFIGTRLVEVLRAQARFTALALADVNLGDVPAGALALEGDLAAPQTLQRIAEFAPDVCFHLAAVPGGASEADYELGRRINLQGTLALFETLATMSRHPREGGDPERPHSAARATRSLKALGPRLREADGAVWPAHPPIVVYSSTIAVYGSALPGLVTPSTPLHPPITYGAHKLACEILLADFSRRGLLDGRSVRLPGIVARPGAPAGLASAFMSNLILELAAGKRFTCPVRPEATAWWMSSWRCAENLMHAAEMDVRNADAGRAWPLPVLRLSIAQVVDTLASLYGADRRDLVDYAPQPALEAVYGNYPPLDDAPSRALGLRDDGSAEQLIRRALAKTHSNE